MSTWICGHKLTRAETETLNAIQDYMRKNASDSHWSASTSPKGDGRRVPIREIFPVGNLDNARRRTAGRLARLGILAACEIVYDAGQQLQGVPLRLQSKKAVPS